MTEPKHEPGPPAAPGHDAKPASLRQVVGAVVWSFFGVRKNRAMQDDLARIRPHQVIIVGVVLAALLVFALLLIVRVIIASA